MLKSIFLLIVTILIFSGCHRYHHSVRAVIIPTLIFEPFHIRSYHNGYSRGHGNHHRRHNSRRGW